MIINGNEINAIIFDLDGTLYCKNGISLAMIVRDLSDIFLIKALLDIRKSLRGIDLSNENDYYCLLFEKISGKSNRKPEQIREWYFNKYCKNFVNILKNKYKPRENLIPLLERLYSNGVKLSILSDYPVVKERLIALNIDPNYFNLIKSSEEYGALKPCKRVLQSIAEELQSPFNKTLVVGDKAETDIDGAIQSGMQFIKISEKKNNPEKNIFVWETFSGNILKR